MMYRMKVDSTIEPKAKKGTIVYDSMKPDYGLANDDTRFTGVMHISVTLNEDGDYPFFTVPLSDLERIKI